MAVTAKLRYLRIAPRKVRQVANLIRGKTTEEAQTILNFTIKKGAHPLLKLLKSAIASARNDFKLGDANLYISKITVDEGPKYKRWMPRARGQASQIQKKTSHITLILETFEKVPAKIKKIKRTEEAKKEKPQKTEETPSPDNFPSEKSKPIKEKKKLSKRTRMPRQQFGRAIRKVFRRKAF